MRHTEDETATSWRRRRDRDAVRRTEALVVGRYPELVRLAYLILPPTLERHRRVLAAHALVQGALPRRLRDVTRMTGVGEIADADAVRARIVRGVDRRRRFALRRSVLPRVWGLKLFPPAGGTDELALEQALGSLSVPARVAYVLRVLDHLHPADVQALLLAAGVEDAAGAIGEAAALIEQAAEPTGENRPAVEVLLRADRFDACSLRAGPSDLLRRRRWRRTAVAV
ncbi:hypothetical protein GT354_06640, partial [Streptomyces sp. SID3343]|nr:hypothetical protein [Streptomyces sp. SID3343]